MKKTNKKDYNYIDYLKDNPKGYWFKRKLYGWGWVPATWQGWLTLLVFVVVFVFSVQKVARGSASYWILLIVITAFLIIVGIAKGEKPKWSWGFKR